MPHEDIGAALMRTSARRVRSRRISKTAWCACATTVRKPFRSVLLGFPLPSILTYQTGGLTVVAKELGLGDDFIGR
jgi:hypothetical protein